MANKVKAKGKTTKQAKASSRKAEQARTTAGKKVPPVSHAAPPARERGAAGKVVGASQQALRNESLRRMLLDKRQEVMNEIKEDLGHSVTEDQLRRVEGMDAGDQAMMDLERELGISLSEMRNRRRQMIDEALIRVEEGLYGICADCGIEISEKRLAAVPFAKLCVDCQTREELLEKIEKEEERE